MLSFHLHKISVAYQHDYIFQHLLFFFFFLSFSRATPTAYGGSQARGLIRAVAAGLHHSHSKVEPVTYTTAHGNVGSLTH